MEKEKACTRCKFFKKYTSGESFINVCEAEEPVCEDVGLYSVAVIDTEEFDSSFCLNFAAAE